jgi:hypothetical protein
MIDRRDNYNGFENIDFFNDAQDTERWLRRVDRKDEANELNLKTLEWFENWKQEIRSKK